MKLQLYIQLNVLLCTDPLWISSCITCRADKKKEESKNIKTVSFECWFELWNPVRRFTERALMEKTRFSIQRINNNNNENSDSNNNYYYYTQEQTSPWWTAGWLAWGQREGEQAETDGQIDRGGHDWAVSVCGEWGPVGTTWIMAPVERRGDQINNSPEEGEERKRERKRMKGGHRRCSSLDHPDSQHAHFFFFFLSQAVQLMYWVKRWLISLVKTET